MNPECLKPDPSSNPKPQEFCIKIITIGDSRVGKSSIIARYVDNNYYHNLASTIGIDYKVKKLDFSGKELKLHIWDTAGQEKFHSITLNFYKEVDGIVLVFDLTDEDSFYNIPHWIREIKLYSSENASIVLLGNKCDMSNRKVNLEKINEFCEEYHLKFFETSAKMNINIEKAFETIVKEIHEKNINNTLIIEDSEVQNKKTGIKLSLLNDDEISDISQCQC